MSTPLIEHIASTQTTTSDAGFPFIVDWHWGEDEDGFYLLGCSFEPLSLDGESMPQMHLTLGEDGDELPLDDTCDWVVSKRGTGYALYFCGVCIVSSEVPAPLLRMLLIAPLSDFQPCDEPAEAYVADLRSSGKVA